MAPEPESTRKVGRKLTKRRKPERHSSVQYPERLKEGDDVQEDVTAAKGQAAQYVNQSVFSMIAAAGSKVDFHARFDDDSSGSEEGPGSGGIAGENATTVPSEGFGRDQHKEVIDRLPRGPLGESTTQTHGPLRSLPKLKLRTKREKNYMVESAVPRTSDQDSFAESPKGNTPRDAPVMSRMLEAQAQAQLGSCATPSGVRKDPAGGLPEANARRGHTTLVARLKEIFGFDTPEDVIAGWSSTARLYDCSPADRLSRVPLLAFTECSTSRLFIHHPVSYLLLCLSTKEICKPQPQ